jgi:hypothetical protein
MKAGPHVMNSLRMSALASTITDAWKDAVYNDAKSRIDPFLTAVIVAFLVSTLLNANYILNHFYVGGAYLLDSGWLMGMFQGHDLLLHVPLAIFGSDNAGYWSIHVSPTLLLFSFLHHLLPIAPIDWFALCVGVIYGLLGGAVAWILMTRLPNNWLSALIAVAASLALIFSPPVVEAVSYPHFEYLFVSLTLLFTIALYARRIWLTVVFFTLALGVREDCGFQIFAILATYLVLVRIARPFDRFEKTLVLFALCGLCWSVGMIVLQKTLAPGDNALVRIYWGNPPFAHVTAAFIRMRIENFLLQGSGFVLFWIYLVIMAVLQRSLVPLAGILAFAPWTLLNILAIADGPSALGLYYGFPLTLGFVWPLVHKMWRRNGSAKKPAFAVGFLAACLLATIIPVVASDRNWAPMPGLGEVRNDMIEVNWIGKSGTRAFVKQLEARPLASGVYVGPAIASLAPWNVHPAQILRPETHDNKIGTIVAYTSYVLGRSLVRSKVAAAGLAFHFVVPHSNIAIYSKQAITAGNYRNIVFEEKAKP